MTEVKPQYSYSRVDLYDRCPYHFKLRYIDKLTELTNYTGDNPLLLGTAMHEGIEHGVEYAIDKYLSSYPIVNDNHINETVKLEILIPKVQEWLSQFDGLDVIHEYEISTEDYRGYVDLIVRDKASGECMVVDFKYSNSIDAYRESNQLHVYKHQLAQLGFNITRLGYLFIEKVKIKYKKNESVYHFRKRIADVTRNAKLTFLPIEYDEHKSLAFDWSIKAIENETEWAKNPTGDCFACNAIEAKKEGRWTTITPPDYLETIQNEQGEIIMALPKNVRRDIQKVTKRIVWLYGPPFSGKTWFANSFPDVLMLNTDGNIKFVDAPYVNIADQVIKQGRVTDYKLAWDVLDETLLDLEKGDHDFKTVVFDLLEDLYTAARFKVYEDLDIDHESDNSFKAWDIVTTKFLSMVKRIINLDVENIIFISHEDTTKDFTKRSGDKISAIQPNLREKVALKVAGMVDIVGRVVANDDDRRLVFKSKSYVFSGGRIPNMSVDEIDLDYDEFINVYAQSNKGLAKPVKQEPTDLSNISDVEAVEEVKEAVEEKPTRTRRKKAEPKEVEVEPEVKPENDAGIEPEVEPETEPEVEEPKPRRARRSRKSAEVVDDQSTDTNDKEDANDDNRQEDTDESGEDTERPRRRRRRSRS
ncbi:NTP-binding protein [Ruoffia tabacinasalis]|uniref:NTP-binding protein n=1 Tax=Ruoffia tabacinasalis TaxID=87458 RepID=A0A5R9EGM7_9LACT|nr:AAA family ATPase [Ruoffia tabacinasalis]TLQ49302.1 NTP-binding protein [Ruoffia tabacinasalis]